MRVLWVLEVKDVNDTDEGVGCNKSDHFVSFAGRNENSVVAFLYCCLTEGRERESRYRNLTRSKLSRRLIQGGRHAFGHLFMRT